MRKANVAHLGVLCDAAACAASCRRRRRRRRHRRRGLAGASKSNFEGERLHSTRE
jgi:hypothetical protein